MPALTADQQRLVEEYLRQWSVAAIMRSRYRTMWRAANAAGHDPEDLAAYGTLGVVRAASRFDPTRGVAFSTYASHSIRAELSRLIAASRRDKRSPEGKVLTNLEVRGETIFNAIPGQEPGDGQDRKERLREAAAEALALAENDRDLMVLKAHYGVGGEIKRTDQEIGELIERTKQRVEQIRSAAVRKIRSRLDGVAMDDFVARRSR